MGKGRREEKRGGREEIYAERRWREDLCGMAKRASDNLGTIISQEGGVVL